MEGKTWSTSKVKSDKVVSNDNIGVFALEFPGKKIAFIGRSINLKSRWGQFKHVLNAGKCENKELQKLWNDKASEFQFKIVKTVTEPEHLMREEANVKQGYLAEGYRLLNDVVTVSVVQPAAVPDGYMVPEKYESIVRQIVKLTERGRLDLDDLKSHLDAL